MRLCSLEIRSFRCLRHVRVEFSAGLNVLYGPNELGKSTLVEALRAALLLPVKSKVAEGFIPWGTDEVPQVVVEFEQLQSPETQDATPTVTRWRLSKSFDTGSRGVARLDRFTAQGRVVKEASGRDVDGRLRDLLQWGVPGPGGKGAPRGLPESYLLTALLGSQDGVTTILTTGLDGDKTNSGRDRLTVELGILGQAPEVTTLLEKLNTCLSPIFTDTGQRRRTSDSPLVKLTDQKREQDEKVQTLEAKVRESKGIEASIRDLHASHDEKVRKHQRIEREVELLDAVLRHQKRRDSSDELREKAEQTEAAFNAANKVFLEKQQELDQASQRVNDCGQQLQKAEKAVTAAEERHTALVKNAAESQESRRSRLQADLDRDRQREAGAQRVLDAETAFKKQQSVVKDTKDHLQAAQCAAVRSERLQRQAQRRGLEAGVSEASHAEEMAQKELDESESRLKVALEKYSQLDNEWQAARNEATAIEAKITQKKASVAGDRSSRERSLRAELQDVESRIRSLNALRQLKAQRVKFEQAVTTAKDEALEAATAQSRATRILELARRQYERQSLNDALQTLDQRKITRDAENAHVEGAQQKLDQLKLERDRASKRRQAAIDAAEKSSHEQQERDRLEGELQKHAFAEEKARGYLLAVRTLDEAQSQRNASRDQLTELDDQSQDLTEQLSRWSLDAEQARRTATRWLLGTATCVLGMVLLLALAGLLSSGRSLTATGAVLCLAGTIATGLRWFGHATRCRQAEHSRSDLQRRLDSLAAQRMITDSELKTLERDCQKSQQNVPRELQDRLGDQFSSLEDAHDWLQKKYDLCVSQRIAAQDKLNSHSETDGEIGVETTAEIEARFVPELSTLEDQIRDAEVQLGLAQKRLGEAEALWKSAKADAEKVAASREPATKLDQVSQLLNELRSELEWPAELDIPSVDEVVTTLESARDARTNADHKVGHARDNLAKHDEQVTEQCQQFSDDPEEELSAAELARDELNARLGSIDNDLLSQLDEDVASHQRAVDRATELKSQRNLAEEERNATEQECNTVKTSWQRKHDDREQRERQLLEFILESSTSLPESRVKPDSSPAEFHCDADEIPTESIMDADKRHKESQIQVTDWKERLRDEQTILQERDTELIKQRAELGQPAAHALAEAQERIHSITESLESLEQVGSQEIDQSLTELNAAREYEEQCQAAAATAKIESTRINDELTPLKENRDLAHEALIEARTSSQNAAGQSAVVALQEATSLLLSEFPDAETSDAHLDKCHTSQSHATREAELALKALNEFRGKLEMAGGEVVREQLEEAQEELARIEEHARDRELEFEAMKFLRDTLQNSSQKHTDHLGRSLARPVLEHFRALTDDRYSNLLLSPSLKMQGVAAEHGERNWEAMSVGTRDQLATLIRLSLAAHLKTTLLLDDQLVHSDAHRLVWFRKQLRKAISESDFQVIVITCRPLDYVSEQELVFNPESDEKRSETTPHVVNLAGQTAGRIIDSAII
jgi:hypothetical protein